MRTPIQTDRPVASREAWASNCRRGFTLVELLVVIAIIAIMAAILLPVFAEARRSAYRATCLSNLHQLGAGLMLYVADHDGTYPIANQSALGMPFQQPHSWGGVGGGSPHLVDVLEPYAKSAALFHCPALGRSVMRDAGGRILPSGSGSYGYRCADLASADGNVGRQAMNGAGTTAIGQALWGGLCGVSPHSSAGWSVCGIHDASITRTPPTPPS